MQIEQLDIAEYTEDYQHDMGKIVFQVFVPEDEEHIVHLHFPLPDRGRDAEIDFDDCNSLPLILFCAMLGRSVEPAEIDRKFFSTTLPAGVFNG